MFRKIRSLFKPFISLFFRTKDSLSLKEKIKVLPSKNFLISPLLFYYSQYAKNDDWKKEGWKDYEEYKYWAPRTCPIACLKMLLSRKEKVPSISKLTSEGLELGGYDIEKDKGWFHYPLIELAKKYGFKAKVEKYLGVLRIVYELSLNRVVVASVNAVKLNRLLKKQRRGLAFFEPTIKHMILVVGYRLKNSKCLGFYFFNPSYPNPKDKNKPFFLKTKNFLSLFNYRGITVWE